MRCLKGVKRGATLDFDLSLPIAFGSTLTAIRSQVRTVPIQPETVGELVDELTVTPLPDTEAMSVWNFYAPPASTTVWDLGTLLCDVQFSDAAGDVAYTETFSLEILEAVTQP